MSENPAIVKKDLLMQFNEAFLQKGLDKDPARRKSMDLLNARGLPGLKSEEYRHTPVSRLLQDIEFNIPGIIATKPAVDFLTDIPHNLIVFSNGIYSADQSRIIDNITIKSVQPETGDAKADPFELLNRGFAEAIEIEVPNDIEIPNPVVIVYHIDAPGFAFINPNWRARIGAGAKVTIIEHTVAGETNRYLNNKCSRIDAEEKSVVDFVMIQTGGKEEHYVNNATVSATSSAQVYCYTCTTSGRLVRNNLTLLLDGEHIDAHLYGLYHVTGSSLIDNHTVVDHRKPNSESNELYKGVMDGNGKAVFNGKIFVRPDAQKTNAFQSNRNLLLSETSNVHTKPQLEIWADDVKCSHGCTTGQLDEEALFYLRSRGISIAAARSLLLNAFASETLEGIRHPELRARVEALILTKLHSAPLS